MKIYDLETYEQIQIETVIQGMTIPEYIKKYYNYAIDDKLFIIGKRIFAFDKSGKFLDCDYEVDGSFCCSYYSNLTSLKGAPKFVNGSFDCSCCDNLTSLKGAPEVVNENFRCYYCKNLTSLDGAPKIVEGHFNCNYCDNLPRNIKKPEGVKGKFYRV